MCSEYKFQNSVVDQLKKSYEPGKYHLYQNMQYTIEKPYKMVTKNAKKKVLNFQLLLGFRGHFRKSSAFEKWVWYVSNRGQAQQFCIHFS